MDMTIENIKASGSVPTSFYKITPGSCILYLFESEISNSVHDLALALYDKCSRQREDFALKVKVEITDNPLLGNCVVARRLNLGSLLHYNLLMVKLNCMDSVDAFVKKFFNLSSRDDSPFKYICKEPSCSNNYDSYYGQSRFNPHNVTMNMIIARPRQEDSTDDEEDILDKTPEEIADENRLIQESLYFADKYKTEIPLETLYKLTKERYIITDNPKDISLVFTENRKLILKAGEFKVELNFTNRELAFYLLVLAHTNGIRSVKLQDYKDELDYLYDMILKNGTEESISSMVENLIGKPKERNTVVSRIKNTISKKLLNKTTHKLFEIQYNNGKYYIELPREFFEYQAKNEAFKIKD